jgi:peptidoglycan/LPS O-acetylase OafA/YrhL
MRSFLHAAAKKVLPLLLTPWTPPAGNGVAPERRPDFDWLRMLSALMVFLFHSSQPFSRNESWPVHNAETHPWLDRFIVTMDSVNMPLMMWIAGATTWHSLRKRTMAQFVNDRVVRILVPCLMGILVLCPPQSYLRRRIRGEFRGSYLQFYPHFFKGIYPEGNLGYYHLWFVAYMFVYSLAALPLVSILHKPGVRQGVARLATWSQRPGALLLFALPLLAGQLWLRRRYPKTYFILNDWAFHALLFPSFVAGMVMASDHRFRQAIDRQWMIAAGLALASTAMLYTPAWNTPTPAPPSSSAYMQQWSLFTICSWSSVIAAAGAGHRFLHTSNRLLDYARHATYPFFILHQPVIATVAYYTVQTKLPILPKFLIIASVSMATTLGLYEVGTHWRGTRLLLGIQRIP